MELDLAGMLGVLVGLVVPTVGAVMAYGKLTQKVTDHEERLDDHEQRLLEVEKTSVEIRSLGQTVENMTERFASEMRHLGEMFGTQHKALSDQLTDLRDEVRSSRRSRRATDA